MPLQRLLPVLPKLQTYSRLISNTFLVSHRLGNPSLIEVWREQLRISDGLGVGVFIIIPQDVMMDGM